MCFADVQFVLDLGQTQWVPFVSGRRSDEVEDPGTVKGPTAGPPALL